MKHAHDPPSTLTSALRKDRWPGQAHNAYASRVHACVLMHGKHIMLAVCTAASNLWYGTQTKAEVLCGMGHIEEINSAPFSLASRVLVQHKENIKS